jgi:hypothetical protein
MYTRMAPLPFSPVMSGITFENSCTNLALYSLARARSVEPDMRRRLYKIGRRSTSGTVGPIKSKNGRRLDKWRHFLHTGHSSEQRHATIQSHRVDVRHKVALADGINDNIDAVPIRCILHDIFKFLRFVVCDMSCACRKRKQPVQFLFRRGGRCDRFAAIKNLSAEQSDARCGE